MSTARTGVIADSFVGDAAPALLLLLPLLAVLLFLCRPPIGTGLVGLDNVVDAVVDGGRGGSGEVDVTSDDAWEVSDAACGGGGAAAAAGAPDAGVGGAAAGAAAEEEEDISKVRGCEKG